jgi:DNA-binding NarL/FixJ family response regulator
MSIHAPSPVHILAGDASGNPRLLIADDDKFVQSALHAQLSRTFDIVGVAVDTDDAITQASALQPDLAIVDVQMPGGGGPRAAREIHAIASRTAIVALSSDESDDVVRIMLEAGAVTYLRKGMDSVQLVKVLMTAISAHAELSKYEANSTSTRPIG